jgi:hypothetical protein
MTLIELLDELGVPYRTAQQHHHVSQGWVGVECNRCSPGSGKFRLGFSLRTKAASCWVCGPTSPWVALAGLVKDQARLRGLWSQVRGSLFDKMLEVKGNTLPTGVWPPVLPLMTSFAAQARDYLQNRGFDLGKLTRLWHPYVVHSAPTAGRIMIPVILSRVFVSYTTRAPDNTQPRYRSAPRAQELVPIKDCLYGHDYVRDSAVVCEGPLDVWKVGPGAVATFGLSYTRKQVAKLSELQRVAVCFDRESKARSKSRALCAELSSLGVDAYDVVLDSGKDPGDAHPDEIRDLRRRFLDE